MALSTPNITRKWGKPIAGEQQTDLKFGHVYSTVATQYRTLSVQPS